MRVLSLPMLRCIHILRCSRRRDACTCWSVVPLYPCIVCPALAVAMHMLIVAVASTGCSRRRAQAVAPRDRQRASRGPGRMSRCMPLPAVAPPLRGIVCSLRWMLCHYRCFAVAMHSPACSRRCDACTFWSVAPLYPCIVCAALAVAMHMTCRCCAAVAMQSLSCSSSHDAHSIAAVAALAVSAVGLLHPCIVCPAVGRDA